MTPEQRTAYEWLARFMEAQAGLAANAMFITFKLGQLGAAGQLGTPELAREMLADLRTDRADLTEAARRLGEEVDHLIANIERSLDGEISKGDPV